MVFFLLILVKANKDSPRSATAGLLWMESSLVRID